MGGHGRRVAWGTCCRALGRAAPLTRGLGMIFTRLLARVKGEKGAGSPRGQESEDIFASMVLSSTDSCRGQTVRAERGLLLQLQRCPPRSPYYGAP